MTELRISIETQPSDPPQRIFPMPSQSPQKIRTKASPHVWKTLLEVEDNDATGYHGGVRDGLVDLSPRPIRCALDVGCAAGGTGAYIKAKYPKAKVIGIEVNRAAAEYAKQKLDHVLIGRFEEVNLAEAGIKPGSIDTVIVADVLEHMYDPWSVLTALRPWLTMDAQIIASIPNVRNLKLMEDLAAGYWRYEDSGLLDITHIRFFTLKEIRRFFHETGYHVRTLQYAIDPRLIAFHEQLSKQPGPLDIRVGRMTLHGVEGAEIDELCSLQFYFIVGNNARIEDIETYRTTPPDLLLLERLAPTPQDGPLWEQHLATWPSRPTTRLFLLDTTGNLDAITATITSLTRQLYSEIQITVVSLTPAPPGLTETGRISWQQYAPDTSPFSAVNSELGQKSEQWAGIVYAGDTLEPAALMRLMELAYRHPESRCIYGDDTRLQQGIPSQFNLKPDFDPWLLQGFDYLSTGLTLFSALWLSQAAGFSLDLRGREILDAALRLYHQQGENAFSHLAEPILHRPLGGNDGDLPFALVNQSHREALLRFSQNRDQSVVIDEGWLAGTLRIKPQLAQKPYVSILMLIESDTPPFQGAMEALLENTPYPALEILLLDIGATNPVTRDFVNALDALKSPQLRVFRLDHPINPIQAANLLAEQAQGEQFVFLRPGLTPTLKTWLDDLVAMASESIVGAVAPRILDKKGRVRSSGLIVGIDQGTADAYQGMAHLDAGTSGRAHLNQRFSSLPGHCLVTRREVFSAAGGLDAEQAETLDNAFTDYGLRLTSASLACLWTPFTSLLNTEQEAAKPHTALPDGLFNRHINLLRRDPAYHPALAPTRPLFTWERRPELLTERFPWRPLPRILTFNADFGGCGYYRIIEPTKALSASYQAESSASCYIFGACEIARVAPNTLVMQRQITDEQQLNLKQVRRLIDIPVAFELDDLMFELPKHNPHHAETPKDIEARLRKSIGLCDRLIVSTDSLAEALRSMHKDIVVVPNYLPTTRWEGLQPKITKNGKPRVGWSGSISHAGDLLIIEEVVRELAQEVDWVFMGLAPDTLRPYIAEYHPGVPFEEYPEALANLNLDLALAPLELCRFNECKTNLKVLEYGILGYPVIATDITPYQGDLPIQRVKNKRAHWVKAIREHINDLDASRTTGLRLQQHIRQHWMLEDHLDEFLKAWTQY